MKPICNLKMAMIVTLFVMFSMVGFGQMFIEFSLDDNPSMPYTGPVMPPFGSAEDEFGIWGTSLGGSPSLAAFGFFDSDVLVPGPALSMTFPPVPFYADAFSANHINISPPPPRVAPVGSLVVFSVDRVSMGIPPGTGAADILSSFFAGGNAIWIPAGGLGLIGLPNVPPLAQADSVDGYNEFIGPMAAFHSYFAMHPASAAAMGFSPADVFVCPPGGLVWPTPVFAPAVFMGLLPGDSIDAMVVWDTANIGQMDQGIDVILFSLAPGSPTLGILGADGATFFWSNFNGGNNVFATSAQLGLIPFADNVDAMDYQ